ncbi:hypothetical protein AB0F17_43545 [Nonomuraea sp. NPDC026600]|uniref:hypothetical protein n=1 Tax=Nonomuraea sp. NPDC026600 TaxID=3155363 RepID=UPI0033FE8737
MFTLLHVSWGLRDELSNASPAQTTQVRELLDLFQRAVSARKRNGENGETTGLLAPLAAMVNVTAEEVEEYTSDIRNSSGLGSRRIRSQRPALLLSKKL